MYSSQHHKMRPSSNNVLPEYKVWMHEFSISSLWRSSMLANPSRRQAEALLACILVPEVAVVLLPAPWLAGWPVVYPQLHHRWNPCICTKCELQTKIKVWDASKDKSVRCKQGCSASGAAHCFMNMLSSSIFFWISSLRSRSCSYLRKQINGTGVIMQ